MIPRLVLMLAAPGAPLLASAFSFSLNSTPTQCANLSIEWSGGVPPYEVLVAPALPYSSYLTPSTAYRPFYDTNTTSTSWSEPLLFSAGSNLTVVLSDATGFGSGGTSQLHTVANGSSAACIPAYAWPLTFSFAVELDTQGPCQLVIFSFDGAYQLPITTYAVVPGGQSLQLPTVTEANATMTWEANVLAGTEVVFVVGDATGKSAGGVAAMQVGSTDPKCLRSNSTASTSATGTSTSAASSASATPVTNSGSISTPSHTGAIVGGVLGGLVAVSVFAVIFVFLRRRQRRLRLSEKAIALQAYAVGLRR